MRRSLVTSFASLLLLAAWFAPSLADDNTLQNMKGSVSYHKAQEQPRPIAVNASIALGNEYYMITGDSSLAQVTLPDSSTVQVGSVSKIQMAFFNQAAIARAKFIVYDGKVRFAVRHPQGAHADYTFQTPTAQIAVRGTQGDVSVDSDGTLQVNVYEVCDVSLPVQVTTSDGKTFSVSAGHSFIAQVVNGILQERVDALTEQMIDQFSPDFGIPTSWDQATGQVVSYADSRVQNAVGGVTGGIGGSYIPSVGGLFGHKATPAPTTPPISPSCSH
jgi:hypothetical protein